MAFCSGTSQVQSAVQAATTTQTASGATAANVATTLQRIVQRQQGCREACVDVVQAQTGAQRAETVQVATGVVTATRQRSAFQEFDAWLYALGQNTGVTIQVVRQIQWASCLHHCGATAQEQVASQQAATMQQTVVGTVERPVAIMD